METDTKAMSLQECKDEIAKKHGFDNFQECYFMGLETCKAELIKYCEEASELYKESALAAQKAELDELKEAKRQYYELWNPVDEFVRNHPDTKLGESVSKKALEMLKSITQEKAKAFDEGVTAYKYGSAFSPVNPYRQDK